jgi:chromosome segregation ATPase
MARPTIAELTAQLELATSRCEKLESLNEQHVKEKTDLEASLKSANDAKDMWYKKQGELQEELNQFHAIFDGLGVPRKHKEDDSDRWSSESILSLSTRWIWFLHNKDRITISGPDVCRY